MEIPDGARKVEFRIRFQLKILPVDSRQYNQSYDAIIKLRKPE